MTESWVETSFIPFRVKTWVSLSLLLSFTPQLPTLDCDCGRTAMRSGPEFCQPCSKHSPSIKASVLTSVATFWSRSSEEMMWPFVNHFLSVLPQYSPTMTMSVWPPPHLTPFNRHPALLPSFQGSKLTTGHGQTHQRQIRDKHHFGSTLMPECWLEKT